EVFHRLSDVAKSVLPHDVAMIQIFSDDHTHARLHALDGIAREHVPEVVSTNWAPLFSEHFQFSIQDDQPASALERERPMARMGLRSTLRVPLWFDGRVGGALEFSSAAVAAYRETDVPVARRIGDYIALAPSH